MFPTEGPPHSNPCGRRSIVGTFYSNLFPQDVEYGLFDHVKNLLDDDERDIETGRGFHLGVLNLNSTSQIP
jgi:hypothetical protein